MFRNYKYDPKDPSDKHSFEIHNIDLGIVNGIRRTILTDIPIPGIIGEYNPTVEILVNTGPLHNEIMIHRIGLIPLCFSEDEIENYEDDSLELELNIKNENNEIQNIKTDKIKGKLNSKELTQKELDNIFPANKITKSHILITRLRTDEHLHLKAKVVKRSARYNASFSTVSLCNFSYIIDEEKAKKTDNILDKERTYLKNKYGEPIAFNFEIESINNNIGPKYLVNKAIEIIISKLDKLRDNISSIKDNEDVDINRFKELENTFEFTIKNEDDTLGNMIQSIIHSKYVRNKTNIYNDMICEYIGYICPHPLKEELIIRITLKDQKDEIVFINFMDYICRKIKEELLEIKLNWNNFTSKI